MFGELAKAFLDIVTDIGSSIKRKPAITDPVVIRLPVDHSPLPQSVCIPLCGIDLIKSFEKCKLEAYLDSRGIPTIGYGHTHGVRLGDTCTQPQADAWLKFDLIWAWEAVVRNVRVDFTQNQGGALLSFAFNLGEPQFVKSGVIRELNAGNYGNVPSEMKKWIWGTMPDGSRKAIDGLVNRRRAEINLWTGSDWRQA